MFYKSDILLEFLETYNTKWAPN